MMNALQTPGSVHLERAVLPGRIWAVVLFGIGFCLTYRMVLLHRAIYSLGENGDGIIVIATLEHWYHVFRHDWQVSQGWQGWRTTGFFYPAHGTLGLTDTFFLYAIPYAGSRSLGFGPFFSFTASVMTFSVAGYWSLYFLCRRWFSAAPAFSAGAACIFAFGVMPVWKLLHVQTYTIMLAPCIGLLLLAGWRSRLRSRRILLGAACGMLCGLIVLSAAQTAWFLCFTGGLAGLVWLLLERPRPEPVVLRRIWPIGAGFLVGVLPASVAILVVYLPIASQNMRDFSEVLLYSPQASDLIHVPAGTPIWSDLLHAIRLSSDAGGQLAELALGYTPGFLVTVLVAGFALIGLPWRRPGLVPLDRAAIACILAALLTWALQLGYTRTDWRPWWVVFHWVPGARAIRTPFRSQLVGQLLMCLAFAHLLTRHAVIAAASLRMANAGAREIRRSLAVMLLLGAGLSLSLVEQIGPGPLERLNAGLVTWLDVAHRPPFACDAFYLIPDPAYPEFFYQRQSDAMLLSQWLDMPTLNGSSSWTPPGWALLHPEAPDYGAKLRHWIELNHLQGKVCGVDPHSGRWVAGAPF